MATQPQIIANRQNAQKSTGPKTQKGKEIVAQNALKHGLAARNDVIVTESQADFDLHRDSLLEELAPQGPTESILADRIVSLSWRLKRADRIQNQTFDAMDEDNRSDPFPNLTKSLARNALYRPTPQNADPQHDLTLGRIALKDFANARVLDRLLMYERRIENSLHKTLQELQRLILIRNLAPSDQIELEHRRLAHGTAGGHNRTKHNAPALAKSSSTENLSSVLCSTPNPRHTTSHIRNTKKQTQSPIPQNQRNRLPSKHLRQKASQPHTKKQTQSNPITPRNTRYATRDTNPILARRDKIRDTQSRHAGTPYEIQNQTKPLSVPSAPFIVYNSH